ncbi:FecR family protein [Thermodesulfovibrio sp. TK110]
MCNIKKLLFMAKRGISFFFYSFVVCFLFISAASAEEVGKITAIQGKVDILRAGKLPAVSARINDSVHLNDVIRTKTDSRAEITFRDGTVVKIAPRSRIDISEYFTDGETLRVTLNVPRGKVGAAVAEKTVEKIKASSKANRFEIKTPIAVAGVRGTNYIVAHYPTYSTVTVITGRVYTYNTQFPERIVEVGAGQSTIIKEGAPPSPPRTLTPQEIQREQRDITHLREGGEERRAEIVIAGGTIEQPPSPTLNTIPEITSITETIKETTPPITEETQIIQPLNVNFTLQSIEAPSLAEWRVTYKVEANNPVVVQYRTKTLSEWSEWTNVNINAQNNVDFSINVYGLYQINIKVKDIYGNIKEWTSGAISPRSFLFSGNIVTDTTANSQINGSVAGAVGFNKGVAKLSILNPVSFNSGFSAGGGNSYGYWILRGSASSSYFRLLTPDYLFTGSGSSSIVLESGGIRSLTTAPWIEVKPLNLSANITGYIHHYDGSKIDELSGAPVSTIFIGRTGQLTLPSSIDESITYTTENYAVGYVPSVNTYDPTMLWGNFQANSTSILKLKGYAGGSWEQDYAIYGLYIGSDNSAGIIKASPGSYQFYDEDLYIFDAEPYLTLKQKTTGYSTMNTWTNYIQGFYQGFFKRGSEYSKISRQDINNTSYGAISSATLSLKKGTQIEPWGVFGIELGGSHSATSPTGFVLEFGGDSWDNRDASDTTPDYWVGSISGTVSDNKMSGEFTGKFMTPTHYGTMEGKLFGELGSNKWVGVVLGSYEPVMELSHLSNIVSDANTSKVYKQNFSPTSARINAYLGGDSFWMQDSGTLYSVGKIIDNYNEVDFSTGYLWYAPISWSLGSNRYSGYIGGRFAKRTSAESLYNLSAYVAGIYNDSTNKGVFIGDLSTDGMGNVLILEKRFFLEGENTVKAVTINTGSIPYPTSPAIILNLSIDTNSYGIGIQNQDGRIIMDTNTNEYTFGAGIIGMGGSYTSTPTAPFEITYTGNFEGGFQGSFGALLKVDTWGEGSNLQNVIHGKTYGYFADVAGTPFLTGIFVGETAGTFDPTNYYWQTITTGVALEAQKFLNMACPNGICNTSGSGFTEEQEKLRKLGIPVVEVGKASFSGSGNNLTVNMNDVVFFSTQRGEKPLLWSTATVNGTYSADPTLNQSITLNATSGASGSVNFTPTYWSNGAWAAKVANDTAYPIQLSGGSYSGSINMQGAATGSYGSGNFSGRASGIVNSGTASGM